MRYFLDTEFNGFGGALMSLALVPEDDGEEFYAVVAMDDPLHPWVARHVAPYLGSVPPMLDARPMSRLEAAAELAHFLQHDDTPEIVADWPDDIAYFCQLIVTRAGDMAPTGSLRFHFVSSPGFSTAAMSQVPHNALHDARALRDFVTHWEG